MSLKKLKNIFSLQRCVMGTLLLSIILGIPGFLAISAKLSIFSFAPGKVDSWIGFWGSYLGGIVGMVAVIITTFFLIGNQNKHHFELLTEQRNSIDGAANLNDKKTREREHKLFLININEELVQSLIQLTKLIKLRIQIFRKIKNIGKEIINLNSQQEFFRNNKIIHEKENSFHETILTLMTDRKASQFRESEFLAEIEIEIAKIRILYARLDLDPTDIESINSLIIENKNSMIGLINGDNFKEEYNISLTKFDQEVTKILNNVTKKHIDNINELFEDYKK